jgi:two-component system OmpR family sensor kinase
VSLRTRLIVGLLAALLTALTIVDVLTYTLVVRAELAQVDQELERAHPPIERAAATPAAERQEALRNAAPGFLVELREPDGAVVLTIPLAQAGAVPITFDDAQIPLPAGDLSDDEAVFASVNVAGHNDVRARVSRQSDDRILVIGRSLDSVSETRERLLAILLSATAGALAVAGVLGLVLIRRGLRPLTLAERAAGEITEEELDRRVPGADDETEVGRLVGAINRMLDRLESAFLQRSADVAALQASEARMRRFVGDASHELRTPIAATAAYAELYERGAKDHPDDLERAMHGIRSETTRMAGLVEDLLLLAQLDEGRPMQFEEVDLTDVAVEAIASARVIAPDRVVTLKIDGVPVVTGDFGRLRQVLDNLIANVRTHTPPETSCTITITPDDDTVTVVVADDGPGMQRTDAELAFERFHRADPSRTRMSGGAGLGLSIVEAIVDHHGGTVTIHSDAEHGIGTTLTIRLPRTPPSKDMTL